MSFLLLKLIIVLIYDLLWNYFWSMYAYEQMGSGIARNSPLPGRQHCIFYAGLRIARKMKASVLTSRTEQ